MNALDRSIQGAASAALSRTQKREVVLLARRAWAAAGRPFFDPPPPGLRRTSAEEELALSEGEAFELWRHEQQEAACGFKHLTAAAQRDYPGLLAHFHALLGEADDAARWLERAAFDPLRQARAKLDRELDRAARTHAISRPHDYALAIARNQFGAADLESLTPRQTWSLYYTIRNRIAARLGLRRPSAKGVAR